MSTITIYHNPRCGTSRNTLAMIRESGVEPEVIEYLKTPPSRETLQTLAAATGQPVRELVRSKDIAETLRMAEDYAKSALAWLKDDGVASQVRVTAYSPAKTVLGLLVNIDDTTYQMEVKNALR